VKKWWPNRGQYRRCLVWFVIALWSLLVLLAVVTALRAQSGDSSGWWQVTIELIGFPLLLYGLFELRQRVVEGQWKPKLDVGIVSGYSEFEDDEELFAEVEVPVKRPDTAEFDRAFLHLVVRNEGRLAARSVKILLENESFDELPLRLRLTDFSAEGPRRYSLPARLDDRQFTVYSGYDEKFWGQVLPYDADASPVALPWHLRLRCRIWADGLGCAIDRKLLVVVKEPQEDDIQN
jgi:hypothetical protein